MARSDRQRSNSGMGPFSPFEWMLAMRYLRAKRKESFISVISGFSFLGIMLGVAVLIIVMSVMNGFRAELLGKILGVNGHIVVQSPTGYLDNFDDLARKVERVPLVERVAPIIDGQVMATAAGTNVGVLVRGIRSKDLETLKVVSDSFGKLGTKLEDFNQPNTVFIGKRLSENLYLGKGQKITLISPRGTATPFGTAPQIRTYTVGGIFEVGMSEYDSSFVYMPLDQAQAFFNRPGEVGALEVMVRDPENVRETVTGIVRTADMPVRVLDWQQMNSSFFNALIVERNVMFLILSLIIMVAALNIIAGLIMLVKDKGRDIAILRTMGASSGAVMRIFLIAGTSIGVVGTLAGAVLGVVFVHNIHAIQKVVERVTGTSVFDPGTYFLTTLPAKLDPVETASIVLMALALSFLATLYPSWRAAKLDPVEALRYE